jgi:hypothetical protein
VLKVDDAGYYQPLHAEEWSVIGPKLHTLATLLFKLFAVADRWPPPPLDLYFTAWNENRDVVLKTTRRVRLRIIELCQAVSLFAAAATLATSNPDAWLEVALKHEDFAADSAFLNGLKHTFVFDHNIQRVGVFVNAASIAWGNLLPCFALARVPFVISWGSIKTLSIDEHCKIPACWRPTSSSISQAR